MNLLGTVVSDKIVSCSLLIMIRCLRMGDRGTTDRVTSFFPELRIWMTWSRVKLSRAVPSTWVTTSPGKSNFLFVEVTSAC